MVSFGAIKAGDQLWDARKDRLGKTENYPVDVIEVDGEDRTALVSWNRNPARWVPEATIRAYRRTKAGKK